MAKKDTRDVGGEQLTDSQILERANAVLKTELFCTRDGHVLAAAAEILKLSDPVRAARCDRIARNLLGAVATPRESRKPTPWDDKIAEAEKVAELASAEEKRKKEAWLLAMDLEREFGKTLRGKSHPDELPDDVFEQRAQVKRAITDAKEAWEDSRKRATKALVKMNELKQVRSRFRAMKAS